MHRTSVRPGRPTKSRALAENLTSLAVKLGPGARLPTVLELRSELGTTLATLNAALTDLEGQRLIVRKPGVGLFVSDTIHHKHVCLVCNPFVFEVAGASPFWSLLVDEARRRAKAIRESFALHFSLTAESEGVPLNPGFMHEVQSGMVDGVLGIGLDLKAIEWLERQGVPVVVFACYGPYGVSYDMTSVIGEGLKVLAGQNCRRIALFRPSSPFEVGAEAEKASQAQIAAYTAAQERYGIPFEKCLVSPALPWERNDAREWPSNQEQGFVAMNRLIDSCAPLPDAILSTDDLMTVGAISALEMRGIRPGKDIQLATHSNQGSPVFVGRMRDITRVEYAPGAVTSAMFGILEQLMAGKEPADAWTTIQPMVIPSEQADNHRLS